MKRFVGWLSVIVVLAACHRPAITVETGLALAPPQQTELSSIDSLLWTRPDSALACLVPWFDSTMTVSDRHYAHLLLAELLYKNDYGQTNRAELLEAVAYFDSLGDAFLAARAHYINGVGYHELDSVVPACEEYLKALEVMEEHFPEKELVGRKAKFLAFTYNRLGELFSEQFIIETAIECYENTLFYCEIEPTSPNGISNTLYRIGVLYDEKGETDKARSYYEQALEKMKYTDNLLYRDIVSSKAIADYQSGIDSKQVLDELRMVIAQANSETELLHRFLTIGAVFMVEGVYDSVLLYFVPVFQNEMNTASKIQVAESLRIIYDSLGNKEKMDECLCFLASNKKPEGESKALVSKLGDLFKSYLNKKQEQKAARERKNAVRRTGRSGILILVLVAAVIVIVMKYRNKRRMRAQEECLRKQHAETEKALTDKNRQLEKERKARRQEKERHQQDLQQKVNQICALEKTIHQQLSDTGLRREAFLNEAVCRKINNRIRKEDITVRNCSRIKVTLTNEDAVALRKAILKHYANFESHLLSKYPKMSFDDMQICQFYLLGLNECQIAVLLCKTYSAIKKRADLLADYMGINGSLSAYILSF